MGKGKVAPRLPESLGSFWRAFMVLHGQRQYGEGGPQPLALLDILAFLQLEGAWVPKKLYPKFSKLMRALDSEYISLAMARQKQQNKG